MGPNVDVVASSPTLPERVDVVVIGGGIIGTSTLLALAERGVSAALCEKGRIAGEQSSRNWGWVRRMGRDPRELPLVVASLKRWAAMHQTVGADVGYRTSGILYLCASEADVERRAEWLKMAGDYVLDTRMVGRGELETLLPGASRNFVGALYTESDGRAEPQTAAPAIARAAQARGAAVLTGCAVRGVETSGGRVSSVVTERGRIACSAVVLAGGAWSSLLCRHVGIRLPQLTVRASVLRTAALDGPNAAAWAPGFAFRKRADGGYSVANGLSNRHDIGPDSFRYFWDFLPLLKMEWRHVGPRLGRPFFDPRHLAGKWRLDEPTPFEAVRVLDPDPVDGHLDEAWSSLVAAFPEFARTTIAQRWAGLIDATPDTVPVISEASVPGFFIATGFSGHGFGIGPGAGRLMADLVTGSPPIVDPAPFRFSRYADGSAPKPYTGL